MLLFLQVVFPTEVGREGAKACKNQALEHLSYLSGICYYRKYLLHILAKN